MKDLEKNKFMVNYTLCWMDEYFRKDYSFLNDLFQKEKNYSCNCCTLSTLSTYDWCYSCH